VTYDQSFDGENRLTSVTVGGQTTTFHYNADGNRLLTVLPNGTKVYTPFPDYEETAPTTGATTQRTTYRLAGQLIAVRVRTGATGNGAVYYAYSDHLGNVVAWTNAGGVMAGNSLARYEPFGNYRTKPATTVNPDISDRGFTGHRQNNTGAYDLGLIYMNARYYLPEIGRFISADTIVPEPGNPQSYNRYSYSYNNPVNYTDPTGHMATSGCDGYVEGCLSDPETWGDNFVAYLESNTNLDDPTDNPQGQIFLEFYYQSLPLGLEDGASVNEIVSQTIVDTVSFVSHARAGWYPTSSDADLLVKTLLLASVAEAGTDSSINGEPGSIRPPINRGGLRRHLGAPPSDLVNPQAHHNLPWEHRDYFAGPGRGLNVNDAAFGRWVEGTPPGLHQNWSRRYGRAWAAWISENPNASRQEVLNFLQSLLNSGLYP
jgi:RHS repeat-associated protein